MILLDTPFNPGDHDPGKSYTHLRMRFEADGDKKIVTIDVSRGYIEDSKFVVGKAAPIRKIIKNRKKINQTRFDEFLLEEPMRGLGAYDALERRLYTFLLDTYPGTIV